MEDFKTHSRFADFGVPLVEGLAAVGEFADTGAAFVVAAAVAAFVVAVAAFGAAVVATFFSVVDVAAIPTAGLLLAYMKDKDRDLKNTFVLSGGKKRIRSQLGSCFCRT